MDFISFSNNQNLIFFFLMLSILLLAFLFGRIIKKILSKISSKSNFNNLPISQAFILSISKSVTFFIIVLALIIGQKFTSLSSPFNEIIEITLRVLLSIAVGIWIYHLVEIPAIWFNSLLNKDNSNSNKAISLVLKQTLKVLVIIIVLLQVFHVVSNKPITPVLASLGIVGAAVALAAQDTFKNFFGAFVLAGDKPFIIGERIVVDGFDGIVESIGMRSTRIKTFNGHLVTLPNGVLVNKTIQNIAKREFIKREMVLNLTYNTSPEKIKEAISILNELLNNHEGMHDDYPPRIYFRDLSSYSLDIVVLYWYFPPAYWDYMAFSQELNLTILQRFNDAGIEFAFPTQTLNLLKPDKESIS